MAIHAKRLHLQPRTAFDAIVWAAELSRDGHGRPQVTLCVEPTSTPGWRWSIYAPTSCVAQLGGATHLRVNKDGLTWLDLTGGPRWWHLDYAHRQCVTLTPLTPASSGPAV